MTVDSGQTLSHYRLLEKIGEGGMGVVWKAEDTVLGRIVAIKVLAADASRDEASRQRFFEEARAASSLSDARIVQVYEFGREADLDFIVMEYIEGKPLSRILHGRPLPADKVAALGEQIAKALARAHRKGLLHRDLKPANILVTPDGDAKVVDFGLAALFSPHRPGVTGASSRGASDLTTQTEGISARPQIAGTLPYMSPEQARGEKLDARSDIFSLGVVLYEMTTGQLPFAGPTPLALMEVIQEGKARPVHDLVPAVPVDLDRIIRKALTARRADRYQAMEDLAVDLRRLGKDLESGSSPSYERLQEALAAPPKFRWRLWLGATAVVVVAAALGLLGWGVLQNRSRANPSGAERVLLILPFEVRGQGEGADYVGRAFAEALAVGLAQARGVRVLPVPALGLGPGSGASEPVKLAAEAGAGRVVTGALTRDGMAIEASLSLVDAHENRILWGARERQEEADLPRLASALVRGLTEPLGVALPVLYQHPWSVTGGPEIAASPQFAVALGALRRGETSAAVEATERLMRAFPGETAALVLGADALYRAGWADPTDLNRQGLERTLAALGRADPNNPYGSLYRAALGRETGADVVLVTRTVTELLDREDLAPAMRAFTFQTRGWIRRKNGDMDGSLADLEEARRREPINAEILRETGETLRVSGRLEEALAAVERAVALDPHWTTLMNLGLTLSDLGRFTAAVGPLRTACEETQGQHTCAIYATALLRSGEREKAREAAAYATTRGEGVIGAYNLACYHAVAGEANEAIRYLRRSLELGYADALMEKDPDLVSLHGDPEFEAIAAEMKRRIGGK